MKDYIKLLKKSPLAMVGTVLVIIFLFIALFAPFLTPYDPIKQDLNNILQPPSWAHPFGTDTLGRDILSRIIYGARISLVIGVLVVAISSLIGMALGLISGFFGGYMDLIIMRITDLFLSFPALILAMAIAGALGPSLTNTMIAISLVWWPPYARLIRGQVLTLRDKEFVEAATALGASNVKIMFMHILPNSITPAIIQATMDLGSVILTAAGLSFIGFGAQPPTPEWGSMISLGRNYFLKQWWLATFPGLAILFTVVGFNLLGDGIRDLLDPRIRRELKEV
ncbi:MAG TPA: ABC transporter permease [Candidatus Atribacteria bacterium]|nr:ABC transporter permease [Candidatus Atribacteria bacterium]